MAFHPPCRETLPLVAAFPGPQHRTSRVTLYFILVAAIGFLSLPRPVFAGESSLVRAPASQVGAAMALLATLQDADVLPPDGTTEANNIVKSIIQCQALFLNSGDPKIRTFFQEALQAKLDRRAEEAARRFREEGWTSEVLEALSESYVAMTIDQRAQLSEGFRNYNLTPGDFTRLSQLFLGARTALLRKGQNIHEIYAQRRREMPGQRLHRNPGTPASPS